MQRVSMQRALWRWLLVACAILSVAPLLSARHLAFTDLPEHVAAMSTLAHWWDPAWPDAHIYQLSARGSPYLAYHAAGALLTVLLGDALRANLLLMLATGLALPFATQALLRASGSDERLALFGCTTFWCRPLIIGFLPFMAALPVTLFTLALALRQHASPTRARGLALALLGVVVFYLHVAPLLLVVSVALLIELATPGGGAAATLLGRTLRLPLRLAWLAPVGVAAAAWLLRSYGEAGAHFMGEGSAQFESPARLFEDFALWTSSIWPGAAGLVPGVVLWLLVAVLALHAPVHETQGIRGLLPRVVPFACAFALFVLVPSHLGVTSMLNARLAVFLLPCALLLVRPAPGRLTAAALVGVAVLSCGIDVQAAVQLHRAKRVEIDGIDALLAKVAPGSRLVTLDFVGQSRFTAFSPWIHLGALHRLRGGGVASVSFAEVPHWPLPFRPEARPPSVPGRALEWEPCRFRNALDGPYFDYVLVRGGVDPFRTEPPGPRWHLAGTTGSWSLYEKRADAAPVPPGPDHGPCMPGLLR